MSLNTTAKTLALHAELAQARALDNCQPQVLRSKYVPGRTSSDDMMLVEEVVVGEVPPLDDALACASAPSACERDDDVDERAGAAASGLGTGLGAGLAAAGRGAAGVG